MIGTVFMLTIFFGVYLLLRSYYEELSLGRFMSYSVTILFVGVLVLWLAVGVGQGLRGAAIRPAVGRVMQVAVNGAVHNVIDDGDIQVIELNADDLDPQIQDALLDVVRRAQRRLLTTDEILKMLDTVELPQDGICGVCYDTLADGNLLGCPECHKAAHTSCLKEWVDSGQNVCIYCRHDLIPT